jgi:hypothetical protein
MQSFFVVFTNQIITKEASYRRNRLSRTTGSGHKTFSSQLTITLFVSSVSPETRTTQIFQMALSCGVDREG